MNKWITSYENFFNSFTEIQWPRKGWLILMATDFFVCVFNGMPWRTRCMSDDTFSTRGSSGNSSKWASRSPSVRQNLVGVYSSCLVKWKWATRVATGLNCTWFYLNCLRCHRCPATIAVTTTTTGTNKIEMGLPHFNVRCFNLLAVPACKVRDLPHCLAGGPS